MTLQRIAAKTQFHYSLILWVKLSSGDTMINNFVCSIWNQDSCLYVISKAGSQPFENRTKTIFFVCLLGFFFGFFSHFVQSTWNLDHKLCHVTFHPWTAKNFNGYVGKQKVRASLSSSFTVLASNVSDKFNKETRLDINSEALLKTGSGAKSQQRLNVLP